MTLLSAIALSGALFLLAITPGPGVFATISNALASGVKNTVPLVLGIVLGDLVFLLFAVYGLSAIAEIFNTLFILIRYLGGGYLIWLGIKLWCSAPTNIYVASIKSRSHGGSFLAGFSITLGNPKVILFYLSFLPTFVHLDTLSTIDIIIVALIVSFILGAVMLFYAYTASTARLLFTKSEAQFKLNRAAGTAMFGTGAYLLAKT